MEEQKTLEVKVEEKKYEEVKPNFWIAKTWTGRYMQVFPIKKDPNKKGLKGNINWKNLIIGDPKMYIFWIMMIVLLLSYNHDVKEYRAYYEDHINQSQFWLNEMYKNMTFECSPENEALGLCLDVKRGDIKLIDNQSFTIK